MNYQQFLTSHPVITNQVDRTELAVILRELQVVLEQDISGDVVEFGCYQGTTSLFLQRMLSQATTQQRQLHVYDSFAGLPPKSIQDASSAGSQFTAGELAVSKKQLVTEFRKAGLTVPKIHKGWFTDLSSRDVPKSISFAFLDGDFYHSILDSLALVWPRLSRGGCITIDDYQETALPGVERAVRDFFKTDSVAIQHEASIAIIKKS